MRNLFAFLALISVLGSGPAKAEQPYTATLYKNPQCGCCEGYAEYLRENGFAVTVEPTDELVAMSRAAGIADELQGCHLMVVDDYVVSGHVPVDTVNRLLSERPPIKGVTLPGMPMGSPGMVGARTEPFTIYEVGDGPAKIYGVE